jgi:hypothetical protein
MKITITIKIKRKLDHGEAITAGYSILIHSRFCPKFCLL